jgi:adenosine deaminase
MDRAVLEYPVAPGLILCLDRAFPYSLNEIIAEKAIAYRGRGVVGIDIAGPESADFQPADYKRLFDRCRRRGLGITVHTGESGPVEEISEVIENLEPTRLGHGVKYTINTDGPEMLRTYIRDELATLGRLAILSVEEQQQVAEWARQASFVEGVSALPPARKAPASRRKVEREEA